MDVTLSGMVIEVRVLHSPNASYPMDVTLSGMVIEVRESHPTNALFPMDVTLYSTDPFVTSEGMVNTVAEPLYFVISTVSSVSETI